MPSAKPRLRIAGQGPSLRIRQRGNFAAEPTRSLREVCRASMAIDKTLAEAIRDGRARGMSWQELGCALGVTDRATDMTALLDALGSSRRAMLEHLLKGRS